MRVHQSFRHVWVIAVWLLVTGGVATAGILETDPNALGEYRGMVHLEGAFLGGRVVSVDLEFAVYAPDDEGSLFDATFGSGADPSGGTEFVYAYQVFNLSQGSSPVTALTIGLDGDEPFDLGPPLGRISFLAGTGDVGPSASYMAPSDGSAPPTSARWAFMNAPYLPTGQASEVLFFTSPGAPELDSATITGAWTASGLAPSPSNQIPVPEPATLAFLGLSALAMLGRRKS